MFYLVGIFGTSSPGDSILSNPERKVQGGKGDLGHTEVLLQNYVV